MQEALQDPERAKHCPGQMDFEDASEASDQEPSGEAVGESEDEVYEDTFSPAEASAQAYVVPGTGAICTLHGAKSLLFRFCAQLPADRCQALLGPHLLTGPVWCPSLTLMPARALRCAALSVGVLREQGRWGC